MLTKNENHSNSLSIAEKYIESDIPFCTELKQSLYTTVNVENYIRYRRMRLSNFNNGFSQQSGANEPKRVPVHVQVDRINFKPRDKRLDEHRPAISALLELMKNDPSLLSEEGRSLCQIAEEESRAKEIVVVANTITGKVWGDTRKLQVAVEDDGIAMVDGDDLKCEWSDEVPDFIRFEEIKREQFYLTEYFSYSAMKEV